MTEQKWAASAVEYKSVEALIPYDRNSKMHPESQIHQIANSIREWGWTMPILIDEGDQVIAGHGRLYAAQHLDLKDVPCVVAKGWSEDKKKAYVIADNKLAEKGGWDNSLLYDELKTLSVAEFDLSLIGMDDAFTAMDFTPNINPTTSYDNVSTGDMSKAQDKMISHMDKLTGDRSAQGTEVMCPYCAESFTFDGI